MRQDRGNLQEQELTKKKGLEKETQPLRRESEREDVSLDNEESLKQTNIPERQEDLDLEQTEKGFDRPGRNL